MDPPLYSAQMPVHQISVIHRSSTMHIYMRQMDPPPIKHRCQYTTSVLFIDLVQCIYIYEADGPPPQQQHQKKLA